MHKMLDQLVTEMVARGVHYEDACKEFERRFISKIMDASDGSRSKAADTLGVHRNTLSRKLKDLKIRTRAV